MTNKRRLSILGVVSALLLSGCTSNENTNSTETTTTSVINTTSNVESIVDVNDNVVESNEETLNEEVTSEISDSENIEINKADAETVRIKRTIKQKMDECAEMDIPECSEDDYSLYGHSDWQVLGVTEYGLICNKNIKNPSPWSIEFLGEIPEDIVVGDYVTITFDEGYCFETVLKDKTLLENCKGEEYEKTVYNVDGRTLYYRAIIKTIDKDVDRSELYHIAEETRLNREIAYNKIIEENALLTETTLEIVSEEWQVVESNELGWLFEYVGDKEELLGCNLEIVTQTPIELPRKAPLTLENIIMRSKTENIYKVSDTVYRMMLKSNITVELNY